MTTKQVALFCFAGAFGFIIGMGVAEKRAIPREEAARSVCARVMTLWLTDRAREQFNGDVRKLMREAFAECRPWDAVEESAYEIK